MPTYTLTVNKFGNPQKTGSFDDTKRRAIPRWAQSQFQQVVTTSGSATALTASAKLSASAHESETITHAGSSQAISALRDKGTLTADKWWYAASAGEDGKGNNYNVLDEQMNVIWSTVHDEWVGYSGSGKLTADEVRYENPMKVGPTRNTGDSDTSPLNPPGSPL